MVRVIGKFRRENKFELELRSKYNISECAEKNEGKNGGKLEYANLLIVEPLILVPTTTIVGAFPCSREAVLKRDFKDASPFSYPCMLGNIIHEIF